MMLHQPGEAAVRTITMMGGGGNGDDGKRTCWVTMNVPASFTGRVCVCVCVSVADMKVKLYVRKYLH